MGYDAAFMKLSAAALTVSEDDIAAGRVLVAVDDDGRVIGVAGVTTEGDRRTSTSCSSIRR